MNNQAAKTILGFNFSANEFVLGAKSLSPFFDKRKFEVRIQDLERIAASCLKSEEPIPNKEQTDQIFSRFRQLYRFPQKANFSSHELRILIYAMYRINNIAQMRSLLYLLNRNWRNRYFNGLLNYILSNWDDADADSMRLVLELFKKRLATYDGKRDKYLILKKNSRFFSPEGPELLGITLRQQDKGQKKACSLRTISSLIFGMSRERLDMQYFSRVIVAYFEKNGLDRLALMEKILNEHNYSPTAKRLIPALVLNEDKRATESQKEAIKTLAVNEIGDPSVPSKWTLSVGTPEEKENLENAREILNEWIKRKFISIFFEKCVQDERRKKFWMEHADMISDFDVFSTKTTKSLLLQDRRIAKLVNGKVKTLNDSPNSALSALGMQIGNYYFVEFSEQGSGSIYIYKQKIKNPSYFYQLKRPHLTTIQSFMLDSDEGKLPHLRDWEKTLTQWFRNHGLL